MAAILDVLQTLSKKIHEAAGHAAFRTLQCVVERLAATTPQWHQARDTKEIRPAADEVHEHLATVIEKNRNTTGGYALFEELDERTKTLIEQIPKQQCEAREAARDEPQLTMLDAIRGVTYDPETRCVTVDSPMDVAIGVAKFIADTRRRCPRLPPFRPGMPGSRHRHRRPLGQISRPR